MQTNGNLMNLDIMVYWKDNAGSSLVEKIKQPWQKKLFQVIGIYMFHTERFEEQKFLYQTQSLWEDLAYFD